MHVQLMYILHVFLEAIPSFGSIWTLRTLQDTLLRTTDTPKLHVFLQGSSTLVELETGQALESAGITGVDAYRKTVCNHTHDSNHYSLHFI